MTAAQDECESRASHADEAEHFWAQDYADEDAFDMWTRRAEAIDFAKSTWEDSSASGLCCVSVVSAMESVQYSYAMHTESRF